MRVRILLSCSLGFLAGLGCLSCDKKTEEQIELLVRSNPASGTDNPFETENEVPEEGRPLDHEGDGKAAAPGGMASLPSMDTLSPEQQKVMNEAIQKAMSKIDLETLVSAIASNHGIEGLETSKLATGVDIRSSAELDPEAMKRLGIDPEMLEGLGGNGAQVQGVSVIVLGDPAGIPTDLLSGGGEALEPGGDAQGTITESGVVIRSGDVIERTTIETETVKVEADDDPERGARFQQHLEAGDSDALAEEIAELIQQGIDTATLQQVLGGVPEPAEEP